MELNEEQKTTVARWFADGASLDEIQKRMKTEFGIHMTYLDVRLLVAELPQPEEPKESQPEESQDESLEAPEKPEEEPQPEDSNAQENQEEALQGPTVTIDALMIPGTLASGDVTFTDGKKGKWFLDRMGRLGLGGDLPQDYRPSPTDAALFQQQLMGLLQAKGLC